jgi:predicted negative regulator of RcsB-dependent stress response
MTRLKQILDDLAKGYITLLPYSAIVTIGIILALGIAIFGWWLFSQSDSELEKEASNANVNATISNTQTNVQERVVERAEESVESTEKTSADARKQREKAKQANTSNTNYDEANRQRCLTYPDRAECR